MFDEVEYIPKLKGIGDKDSKNRLKFISMNYLYF